MTKEYKHKEKGFIVKIEVRKGKPVVTSNGLIQVNAPRGFYKGCNAVREDVFEESFEVVDNG